MKAQTYWVLAVLTLVFTFTARAYAQTDAASQIYRLNDNSTYQQGCFPPCECPIMEEARVRGTFKLTFTGSDGLFDYYAVEDVNWTVSLGNPERRLTGSGTYKVGGEFAVRHQLELDLSTDGGAPQHFDSGLVQGGGDFPHIAIAIAIAINGFYCYDTAIYVDADLVKADQIRPYGLTRDTTYQRGCFPPCLCPFFQKQPLRGTLGLVRLESGPLFTEYAVVNVNWQVLSPNPKGPADGFPITGFGLYRIGGEVAVQHQMGLDLHVNGDRELTHFDSGLVAGGGNFPAIDILLSVNGVYCFDQVIDLHAKPGTTRQQ